MSGLAKILAGCGHESKKMMENGEEPACLVDFWMAETVKEIKEEEMTDAPRPPHSDDTEIGGYIF